MAPPMLPRLVVDGSGANLRPWGAPRALSWSSTMPGSTHAHPSSGFISMSWFMWREKSMTTAWFTVCPASPVPPPRGSTGTP